MSGKDFADYQGSVDAGEGERHRATGDAGGAMRFAYADPPYPGQAKLYRNHPDYAGEVDHAALVPSLDRDFPDGWALSTSITALREVLPLCGGQPPGELRVAAWITGPTPRPPARAMWTWEPVIVRTSRWRQRAPGDFVWDSLRAYPPRGFLGGTIKGQKPMEFSYWVFDLLGASPGDEVVDLFPGSGAVGHAWHGYCQQMRLGI